MTAGDASLILRPSRGQRWRARVRRLSPFDIVSIAVVIFVLAVIAYPLGSMIITNLIPGGNLDVAAFQRILADKNFHVAALNTVILIGVGGVIAIVIGSAFAWLSERTDARVNGLATILPLVPLILPPIGLSIGWIFLADKHAGLLNVAYRAIADIFGVRIDSGPFDILTWPGMIFMYVVYFVPFVYVLMSAALRNLDPTLEEASRMSGGSTFTTFFRISLPAVLPALAASVLVVIIVGIAQFSFGRTIGTGARIPVLSVYMVNLFKGYPADYVGASVVSVIVLVFITLIWFLQQRLTRRAGHATISGKSASASVIRLGPMKWVVRVVMIGYLLLVSVLPLLALLIVALQPYWTPTIDVTKFSFDNFAKFLIQDAYSRQALLDSIGLGLAGATIGMLIAALLVSYGRLRGGRTLRVVGGVARAPGAISHIVLAVAFLLAFAGPPFHLAGTLGILLLVYIVMNLPQAWISAESGMDQVGQDLMEASAMNGSSQIGTFLRVNLPLMANGLAAGWSMLFIVIVGDLTASAILAGPSNPVVGFVVLDVYDTGTYSQLAALSAAVSVITGVIVFVVLRLSSRLRTDPGRSPERYEPTTGVQ
jgi:iron(III) transport system permease protein